MHEYTMLFCFSVRVKVRKQRRACRPCLLASLDELSAIHALCANRKESCGAGKLYRLLACMQCLQTGGLTCIRFSLSM